MSGTYCYEELVAPCTNLMQQGELAAFIAL